MALYAFIGVAVTSATTIIYGQTIWDPTDVLARFKNPVVLIVAMLALCIATLATNIAANVVSPANDFSNLSPRKISFRTGGLITGIIGVLIMPWKLVADPSGYIFTWLIGYSALLGPIGGVINCGLFRGTPSAAKRRSTLRWRRTISLYERNQPRGRHRVCAGGSAQLTRFSGHHKSDSCHVGSCPAGRLVQLRLVRRICARLCHLSGFAQDRCEELRQRQRNLTQSRKTKTISPQRHKGHRVETALPLPFTFHFSLFTLRRA